MHGPAQVLHERVLDGRRRRLILRRRHAGGGCEKSGGEDPHQSAPIFTELRAAPL
jgi:hypothetical protein